MAEPLHGHLALQPAGPGGGAGAGGALFPVAAGEDDIARRDGVDPHAGGPGDLGQFLGQVVHGRLGRAVGERRAERAQAGDGADQQDRPFAARLHASQGAARQAEGRAQVLGEAGVPGVVVHLGPRRAGMQTHIGHRAEDRTQPFLGELQGLLDGGGVAHVPGHGPDLALAVLVRQPGAGGLKLRRAPGGDRHLGALGQAGLDDAQADAATGAGHEDHPVLEPQIHARFLGR